MYRLYREATGRELVLHAYGESVLPGTGWCTGVPGYEVGTGWCPAFPARPCPCRPCPCYHLLFFFNNAHARLRFFSFVLVRFSLSGAGLAEVLLADLRVSLCEESAPAVNFTVPALVVPGCSFFLIAGRPAR
eukprot:SAG31_NODE_15738_length_740_cov_2.405616_1_plen_131_part_10